MGLGLGAKSFRAQAFRVESLARCAATAGKQASASGSTIPKEDSVPAYTLKAILVNSFSTSSFQPGTPQIEVGYMLGSCRRGRWLETPQHAYTSGNLRHPKFPREATKEAGLIPGIG